MPRPARLPHYLCVRREIQALTQEADRLEKMLEEEVNRSKSSLSSPAARADPTDNQRDENVRHWKRVATTEAALCKDALDRNARLKAVLRDRMLAQQLLKRRIRLCNEKLEVNNVCYSI